MSSTIQRAFARTLSLPCALGLVLGACTAAPEMQASPAPDKKGPAMQLGNFSVSLNVKDLAASRAFYEKLGFHVRGGNQAQNWLVMQNDSATIGLFQGMFEKNSLTFNPGWDRAAKPLPAFDDVRDIQRTLVSRGMTLTAKADESTTGPAYITLTDPDGKMLPDQRGSVGHLKVRGPSVIDSYFKRPEDVLDEDGFFDTGDLAMLDAESNLTICGRSKDLIKSGGEWINPAEMEAIVGRDPTVGAVAVIGRADARWLFLVTQAAVLATVFLSITLVTGLAGQISLCQGAFAAIGAFTVFQLVQRWDVPVLVAAVVGALIAAVVGALLSLPIRRLGGVWTAIATLAFAYFFDAVLVNMSWVSGGVSVLQSTVVPRPTLGPIDFNSDKSFLVLSVVVLAIVALIVAALQAGTFGKTLAAVRGSEVAAQSIGISPARLRLIAFAISLVAGALGLTGISEAAARVAKFLFVLFLVLAIAVLVIAIAIGQAVL